MTNTLNIVQAVNQALMNEMDIDNTIVVYAKKIWC